MVKAVLLNNIDHRDLYVRTGHGAEFGDAINLVRVFAPELEALQREYPILLRRKDGGAYHMVALLGLARDENLFLGCGHWNGRYVPALLERGPFSIVSRDLPGNETADPMIYIDLEHPRVSREEGHRLFLPQGGNAPYLDHMRDLLGAIFNGVEIEKSIFSAFEAHGLIEPIDIEVKLDATSGYRLSEFYTISLERLRGLDGTALEQLHRADHFRAAVWIASSLQNIDRLIELKNARSAVREVR